MITRVPITDMLYNLKEISSFGDVMKFNFFLAKSFVLLTKSLCFLEFYRLYKKVSNFKRISEGNLSK